MDNSGKKINIDLNFIVEQVTPVTFVCSNLPDRKIFIEKKGTNYYYTTTFHESGFSFSYSTETIQYSNRPVFSVMEKIQHDLSSSFFNYVDEKYAIISFKDIPSHKSVEMALSQEGQLFFFFVSIKFSEGNSYNILQDTYIYDNENDDLFKRVYKTPDKLIEILDCKHFSEAFLSFYESLSTDRLIFDIRYHQYMKNITVVFSTEDITIHNLMNKSKSSFHGKDIVLSELENIISTMIINRPTNEFFRLVSSLNLELSKLTLNDIRVLSMVLC